MKNKKGAELSLTVIIVAALGLLVLVILAFLVVNKFNIFGTTEKNNCSLKGGICKTVCDTTTGEQPLAGATCDSGKTCCKLFG